MIDNVNFSIKFYEIDKLIGEKAGMPPTLDS